MERSDWFVPRIIHRSVINRSIDERDSGQDGQFKVLYCYVCEKAHECIWEDNRLRLNYYLDFPSIGLERKICDKCKQ